MMEVHRASDEGSTDITEHATAVGCPSDSVSRNCFDFYTQESTAPLHTCLFLRWKQARQMSARDAQGEIFALDKVHTYLHNISTLQ